MNLLWNIPGSSVVISSIVKQKFTITADVEWRGEPTFPTGIPVHCRNVAAQIICIWNCLPTKWIMWTVRYCQCWWSFFAFHLITIHELHSELTNRWAKNVASNYMAFQRSLGIELSPSPCGSGNMHPPSKFASYFATSCGRLLRLVNAWVPSPFLPNTHSNLSLPLSLQGNFKDPPKGWLKIPEKMNLNLFWARWESRVAVWAHWKISISVCLKVQGLNDEMAAIFFQIAQLLE